MVSCVLLYFPTSSIQGEWEGSLDLTYHGVGSEGADLLDSARSTLLEGNTVRLLNNKKKKNQSSARMPS